MVSIIAIIFFIICILIFAALVYWVIYAQQQQKKTLFQPLNSINCDSDYHCPYGTYCVPGDHRYCDVKRCVANSDCDPNGNLVCLFVGQGVSGFCNYLECDNIGDCPIGSACANGVCVKYGNPCSTSNDCYHSSLSCIITEPGKTGICGQCNLQTDTVKDCGDSQICDSAEYVCRPKCEHDNQCSSDGSFICAGAHCCLKDVPLPYYVDGNYTCRQGVIGQGCSGDGDCASGYCLGKICSNKADNCVYNYDENVTGNLTGYCGKSLPYCSRGKCSATSEGAPCSHFAWHTGDAFNAFNACNILPVQISGQATVGTKTVPTSGYVGASGASGPSITFCVNDICQISPGLINDRCTDDKDCSSLSSAAHPGGGGHCILGHCG